MWNYVSHLIQVTASARGLRLTKVKMMRKRHTMTRFGQCSRRGVLRITLRAFSNGEWARKPEMAYDIVDAVAHELAHLRHYKHNAAWFALYANLLACFAASGVYHVVSRLRK